MREVYPTARFLGIVAGGDFTAPARQLVQSRQIDLFYVPKAKIIAAFAQLDLQIDYPDRSPETAKAQLANAFEHGLTVKLKQRAAKKLQELVGAPSLSGYIDRVRAALSALPQEIRFISRRSSSPQVFETIPDATAFLQNPDFDFSTPAEAFVYQITYTDGTEFERAAGSLDELRELHRQIERLAQHLAALTAES